MPAPVSLDRELLLLIRSFHPLLVVETVEESRLDGFLGGVAREVQTPYFTWTAAKGLWREPAEHEIPGLREPDKLLEHLAERQIKGIFHLKDFAPLLAAPVQIRAFRELTQKFRSVGSTLVLSGPRVNLPVEVQHKSVQIAWELPTRSELRAALISALEDLPTATPVKVTLRKDELSQLVQSLVGLTTDQARQVIARCALEDGELSLSDISQVQARKAQLLQDGGLLEYFVPSQEAPALGGFGRLKAWLQRAEMGFSKEAAALKLDAPRGILFVGVQGCGKSLAAKAVAQLWRLPLLRLDAGRLLDKFVGESEKNFRRAIQVAEAMAPSVLWIDEIEKSWSPASSGEMDGGLGRRMLGSFLTWLQEKKKPVFVVATANDVSALPPELLRKGRFDEIFFVDLPDLEERVAIVKIHLERRMQPASRFDLETVAARGAGFSGAELEQAVVSALYGALAAKEPLDTARLLDALGETIPLSVSRREDIEALRRFARERFVPVA